MAKIGTEWLWKAHKRTAIRAEDPHGEVASLEPIYRETHYCLRADMRLLQRKCAAYPDHFMDGELRRMDFGWKRYGKVKPDGIEKLAEILRRKGFEMEYPS